MVYDFNQKIIEKRTRNLFRWIRTKRCSWRVKRAINFYSWLCDAHPYGLNERLNLLLMPREAQPLFFKR